MSDAFEGVVRLALRQLRLRLRCVRQGHRLSCVVRYDDGNSLTFVTPAPGVIKTMAHTVDLPFDRVVVGAVWHCSRCGAIEGRRIPKPISAAEALFLRTKYPRILGSDRPRDP